MASLLLGAKTLKKIAWLLYIISDNFRPATRDSNEVACILNRRFYPRTRNGRHSWYWSSSFILVGRIFHSGRCQWCLPARSTEGSSSYGISLNSLYPVGQHAFAFYAKYWTPEELASLILPRPIILVRAVSLVALVIKWCLISLNFLEKKHVNIAENNPWLDLTCESVRKIMS